MIEEDFEKDFKELDRIRKHVPLINVSQVDIIWLVTTLKYYMTRCKVLEEERKDD